MKPNLDRRVTFDQLRTDSHSSFYYLASPYSGPERERELRVEEVWRQMSIFMKNRVPVFCPIWTAHRTSQTFNLPDDVEYWWDMNLPFLRFASGLIIASMPGVQRSRGLVKEVEYTFNSYRPIYITTCVPRDEMLEVYEMDVTDMALMRGIRTI